MKMLAKDIPNNTLIKFIDKDTNYILTDEKVLTYATYTGNIDKILKYDGVFFLTQDDGKYYIVSEDCPLIVVNPTDEMYLTWIHSTEEYKLIKEFYSDKVASRSGVPLINHIDEGLEILIKLKASEDAMKAFCLHPLIQNDKDLADNFSLIKECDSHVVALVMEYRNIANSWLSDKVLLANGYPYHNTEIKLSPLEDVNDMLRADKIQNYKDFLIYHKGIRPRSDELDYYFNRWIEILFKKCDVLELMLEITGAKNEH